MLSVPCDAGDPLQGYDVGFMQLSGNGISPPISPLIQLDKPELSLGLPNQAIPAGDTAQLLGYGVTARPLHVGRRGGHLEDCSNAMMRLT